VETFLRQCICGPMAEWWHTTCRWKFSHKET